MEEAKLEQPKLPKETKPETQDSFAIPPEALAQLRTIFVREGKALCGPEIERLELPSAEALTALLACAQAAKEDGTLDGDVAYSLLYAAEHSCPMATIVDDDDEEVNADIYFLALCTQACQKFGVHVHWVKNWFEYDSLEHAKQVKIIQQLEAASLLNRQILKCLLLEIKHIAQMQAALDALSAAKILTAENLEFCLTRYGEASASKAAAVACGLVKLAAFERILDPETIAVLKVWLEVFPQLGWALGTINLDAYEASGGVSIKNKLQSDIDKFLRLGCNIKSIGQSIAAIQGCKEMSHKDRQAIMASLIEQASSESFTKAFPTIFQAVKKGESKGPKLVSELLAARGGSNSKIELLGNLDGTVSIVAKLNPPPEFYVSYIEKFKQVVSWTPFALDIIQFLVEQKTEAGLDPSKFKVFYSILDILMTLPPDRDELHSEAWLRRSLLEVAEADLGKLIVLDGGGEIRYPMLYYFLKDRGSGESKRLPSPPVSNPVAEFMSPGEYRKWLEQPPGQSLLFFSQFSGSAPHSTPPPPPSIPIISLLPVPPISFGQAMDSFTRKRKRGSKKEEGASAAENTEAQKIKRSKPDAKGSGLDKGRQDKVEAGSSARLHRQKKPRNTNSHLPYNQYAWGVVRRLWSS